MRPSQRTTSFNQVCKYDFKMFPFFMSFLCFYAFLYFLSFCGRQGCFPRSYVSSIAMRKSELRSCLRTKHWLSCFFFLLDILWSNKKSFKALDHLYDLLILLKGEKTLRHWTINDLLVFWKKWQSYVWILGFRKSTFNQ